MYGRDGRGIWRRFESGKCTSLISMIKGFGLGRNKLNTARGPGLKGTVRFLEAQQTSPAGGIGFMYWQLQSTYVVLCLSEHHHGAC